MNKQSFFIIIIFLFSSCKKTLSPQYSNWTVNGASFSTNDIKVDEGKARHEIVTNNYHNGFQIIFNLGYFPTNGNFKLDCSLQDPNWVCFNILFRDTGYLPKVNNSNLINATINNSKGSYVLQPTWFYNSYRTNDSISVQGVFNIP
jgi:hypothetical protein